MFNDNVATRSRGEYSLASASNGEEQKNLIMEQSDKQCPDLGKMSINNSFPKILKLFFLTKKLAIFGNLFFPENPVLF